MVCLAQSVTTLRFQFVTAFLFYTGNSQHGTDNSAACAKISNNSCDRWAEHSCNVPGCQEVITFDGGMKAQV